MWQQLNIEKDLKKFKEEPVSLFQFFDVDAHEEYAGNYSVPGIMFRKFQKSYPTLIFEKQYTSGLKDGVNPFELSPSTLYRCLHVQQVISIYDNTQYLIEINLKKYNGFYRLHAAPICLNLTLAMF